MASRVVVVEAPAGCGKTQDAAAAALELARGLPTGREVLLLAHTNAAVQEFRRRVRDRKEHVRAMTLDAFAYEFANIYAGELGIERPIEFGGAGVDFATLSHGVCGLFERSPSVAKAAALHYPAIVLDEHQDARRSQDRLVRLLAATGDVEVRIYGDPMQAIYDNAEDYVNWQEIRDGADEISELRTPHRWSQVPALGEWILSARDALMAGRALPLLGAPPSVKVTRVRELWPFRFNVRRPPAPLYAELAADLTPHRSIGVLAHYRASTRGLAQLFRGRIVLREELELPVARRALRDALDCTGDPQKLASVLVKTLKRCCTGLTKAREKAIRDRILADGICRKRKHAVRPVVDQFQRLYDDPGIGAFCKCLAAILASRPDWLKIDLRDSLEVLSRVRIADGFTAQDSLNAVIQRRKHRLSMPQRVASTVHGAKGLAFDHVFLGACNESFKDTEYCRRLLYVALSRARESLHIVGPHDAMSPLIDR